MNAMSRKTIVVSSGLMGSRKSKSLWLLKEVTSSQAIESSSATGKRNGLVAAVHRRILTEIGGAVATDSVEVFVEGDRETGYDALHPNGFFKVTKVRNAESKSKR
jgi:hypothetical protein